MAFQVLRKIAGRPRVFVPEHGDTFAKPARTCVPGEGTVDAGGMLLAVVCNQPVAGKRVRLTLDVANSRLWKVTHSAWALLPYVANIRVPVIIPAILRETIVSETGCHLKDVTAGKNGTIRPINGILTGFDAPTEV